MPLKHVMHVRIEKAKKAALAMFGKCYRLGLHNVHLQSHLFDTLALSVLSYGCEVWGPELCSDLCVKGVCTGVAEEQVHRPFMRQALGVCKTTPVSAMMRELRRHPLAVHWLSMVLGFWNRAVRRPVTDYLHVAMKENMQLAADSSVCYRDRQRLWGYHFMRCMTGLGVSWRNEDGQFQPIKTGDVIELAVQKWYNYEWGAVEQMVQGTAWARNSNGCVVRAAPSSMSGFKQLVYQQWFADDVKDSDDEMTKWARYTFTLRSYPLTRIMAQFRLGSHWLNVQQGRFRGIDRAGRVCPRCTCDIEDEMHVFACPLYNGLRDKYGITGPADLTDLAMRSYMNTNEKGFTQRLAAFLVACRDLRLSLDAD